MKIMTTREVAELLQVEAVTLRRWIRQGEIVGSKTPAGWRFTESDVQAFLDQHRNKPTQEETQP